MAGYSIGYLFLGDVLVAKLPRDGVHQDRDFSGELEMTIITMTEFRQAPGEILNRMRYFGETFTLTKQGKPVAYLLPIQVKKVKPTPDELNEILSDQTFNSIEVMPDGSLFASRKNAPNPQNRVLGNG